MCRVHRAQLQLLRGEWDEAERNALWVGAQLDANRSTTQAWYVVAEARRLRGDPSAADAYDEAHARGRDPQPGRALLRLQEGDPGRRRGVGARGPGGGRPRPLAPGPTVCCAVEIAVAAGLGDAVAASELVETASTYATSGLEAMAAAARRGAVAEDRAEEALPVLRDACRRWHELGAAYDAAGTCVRLAEAYRALGVRRRGGCAGGGDVRAAGSVPAGAELPDGLTRRESEVLTLADGRSNRQIGEALYISDRTVARHLTNIFTKIGVTSRTQAARYAIDRGLTGTR